MNNGNRRKKYRVRYDRLAAVILAIAVIAVVITSCVKGVQEKNDPTAVTERKNTASAEKNTSPTIVDNLDTTVTSGTIPGTTRIPPTAADPTNTNFVTEAHSYDDVFKGDLVLVNTTHIYHFDEGDTDLVTLYDNIKNECYGVSDYVIKLDSHVVEQLNALMESFSVIQSNTDIVVIGGYRSYEQQNEKYAYGTTTTNGGFSDYHTGRTFDLGVFPKDGSSSGYYSPTGIYSWIDENAAGYGFIVRYPDGKENFTGETSRTQTYRYVGVPHSTYIKQNNICLEEYIDKVKEYTKEKPLEISSGSDLYRVYYVKAVPNAVTDVPVPSDMSYTISGDNDEGFIVTVKVTE